MLTLNFNRSAHRSRKFAAQPWYLQSLFIMAILANGAVFAWFGWDAISHRYFEYEWHAIGPTIGPTSGKTFLEGPDAVRAGIGLFSAGLMVSIWSLGLWLQLARRSVSRWIYDTIVRILAFISFVLLLVSVDCFFPISKPGSIPFFATLLLIAIVLWLARHLKNPRLVGRFFPFLVIAAIITFIVGGRLGTGIVVAVFVCIAVFGHLLVLFPQLERNILSSARSSKDTKQI